MVYTINPNLSNKKRINKIIASFLLVNAVPRFTLVYCLCLSFYLLASDLFCFFSPTAIQVLILRLSLLVKHYNNYLPLSNFCSLHRQTTLHYATNVYTEAAGNECESFQHDEIHWEGWPIPDIITTISKENYNEISFHLMWVYKVFFTTFQIRSKQLNAPLLSLEQPDCIRLHQQMYILRVRLVTNSSLSELLTP